MSYPYPFRNVLRPALYLLFMLVLAGCAGTRELKRTFIAPENLASLDGRPGFLKAHLHNGQVVVFEAWSTDTAPGAVTGQGVRLDVNRDTLAQGLLTIPVESVALFESNVTATSGPTVAMALITGASVALTVFCLSNTKACFGSCPTFYVPGPDSLLLQAEGFSASIAPALEARDVDALYRAKPAGTAFDVVMKNEALETHVVRYVNVLAVPHAPGRRVVAAGDSFREVAWLQPPQTCRAPEGDCRAAVLDLDAGERFSPADSTDLAAKEVIDLAFEPGAEGPYGLALGVRQTLLSTFILYQALAYMGDEAGAWLARLERGELKGRGLADILGGIEVLVPDGEGAWQLAGVVDEHGPLATDIHLVSLPDLPPGTRRVRLRLTKGNWRLDYIALAGLGASVKPLRLPPAAVLRDGVPDAAALTLLRDTTAVLSTLPGDAYTLQYELPEAYETYELFLESQGYYLEWIRSEWLREKDGTRLAKLLLNPSDVLRDLAPAFKKIEADMEGAFWRSRYVEH